MTITSCKIFIDTFRKLSFRHLASLFVCSHDISQLAMRYLENNVQQFVRYVTRDWWNSFADQRSLPYVSDGPLWLVQVLASYLLFVIYGQRWMMKRQAFNLQSTIRVYNLLNVAVNVAFFISSIILTNASLKCWSCHDDGTDLLSNPKFFAYYCFAFLGLKLFDLLDTVFFVLRKKSSQITFLHVVHHMIMPMTTWVGMKYVPRTPTLMTMVANSFVHVIMYYYYYLSASGKHWCEFL